jgi:hypothetical protein
MDVRRPDYGCPRAQRPPKVFQPRTRRPSCGELIQIDGNDHRWFEQRAPACTLLVFIDDATGRLMALHFTATESTFSYFEALGKYLKAHGKPRGQARLSKVNYVYIQAVQMF